MFVYTINTEPDEYKLLLVNMGLALVQKTLTVRYTFDILCGYKTLSLLFSLNSFSIIKLFLGYMISFANPLSFKTLPFSNS